MNEIVTFNHADIIIARKKERDEFTRGISQLKVQLRLGLCHTIIHNLLILRVEFCYGEKRHLNNKNFS